jgi:uncharacterized protein
MDPGPRRHLAHQPASVVFTQSLRILIMSNMFDIIRTSDLAVTRWKNGGGQARELAAYPSDSGYDDFRWRVSIADIECDGPFSDYPGIDRTIVLLDGAGMLLRSGPIGTLLHTLDEKYKPFDFVGEEKIEATLIDGAALDFNLLVRRHFARGSVAVWNGPASFDVPNATRLIFVAKGEVALNDASAAKIALRGGDAVRLREREYRIQLSSQAIVLAVSVEILPIPDQL